MRASYNHPIRKSKSRSGSASAELQNDARRRLCSWWRANGNSAGLPIGEHRLSLYASCAERLRTLPTKIYMLVKSIRASAIGKDDRRSRSLAGPEPPGKPDVVAISIGFADQ